MASSPTIEVQLSNNYGHPRALVNGRFPRLAQTWKGAIVRGPPPGFVWPNKGAKGYVWWVDGHLNDSQRWERTINHNDFRQSLGPRAKGVMI